MMAASRHLQRLMSLSAQIVPAVVKPAPFQLEQVKPQALSMQEGSLRRSAQSAALFKAEFRKVRRIRALLLCLLNFSALGLLAASQPFGAKAPPTDGELSL
jgi:hypothetical protein